MRVKNHFAGFAALTIEFVIREGELVTHAAPHSWCKVGIAILHLELDRYSSGAGINLRYTTHIST